MISLHKNIHVFGLLFKVSYLAKASLPATHNFFFFCYKYTMVVKYIEMLGNF